MYYQVAQQLEQAIESGELAGHPPRRRGAPGRPAQGVLADAAAGYRVPGRPRLPGAQARRRHPGGPPKGQAVGADQPVRRPDHGRQATPTTVLSIQAVLMTDAVAHALDLDEGGMVMAFERLRYADDQPLAVMRNRIPKGLVEPTPSSSSGPGCTSSSARGGISLHHASQTIGARAATTAEARLLHGSKGEPLLTMRRTTYNETGQPVELGDHTYRQACTRSRSFSSHGKSPGRREGPHGQHGRSGRARHRRCPRHRPGDQHLPREPRGQGGGRLLPRCRLGQAVRVRPRGCHHPPGQHRCRRRLPAGHRRGA